MRAGERVRSRGREGRAACPRACGIAPRACFHAGAKGKRYALPNATVHMHQALGGGSGQAADVEIQARELSRNNEKIRQILSDATGQPMDRIKQDTDRDIYLTAEEAKAYGLVDEILTKPS